MPNSKKRILPGAELQISNKSTGSSSVCMMTMQIRSEHIKGADARYDIICSADALLQNLLIRQQNSDLHSLPAIEFFVQF